MKKLIFVFLILILGGCTSQKVYTDFDYSFARSGGRIPMYENLLITGNNVHYSFEGQGKDNKSDASLIMPKDQARWDEIVSAFQKVIDRNIKTES